MNPHLQDVKPNRVVMRFGENHNDRLRWLVYSAQSNNMMMLVSEDAIVSDLVARQNRVVPDERKHWRPHMFSTAASMLAELERQPRLLQKNVYNIFIFDPPAVFERLPEFRVQEWLTLMADPASTLTYVH